ncbi:hypothetical protein K1W54_28990, partial [Micromonospora sp. CPCC 205371]|nr:hypothetical protein [Micromonospora sp. CPCC 205371]
AAPPARGTRVSAAWVPMGATDAWWWWTLFGDIPPTADAAFRKISTTLRGLVVEMLERAAPPAGAPRAAALAMAQERAAAARS